MSDVLALLDPRIQEFIAAHDKDDVAKLALKKPPVAGWPYPQILQQIKSRQSACDKIPSWLAEKNIILPDHSVIEQASSDATAAYKASLVTGDLFCDLTAGAGVDTREFLKKFTSGIAVEKDKNYADLLAHNLKVFSDKKIEIINSAAEDIVLNLPPCDFIYADPQRRDQNSKGKFRFEDGSPDIVGLLPSLLSKAPVVMLKTSPVLDIKKAIDSLYCVTAIHIVEWHGACREVLYIMRRNAKISADDVPLTAAVLNDEGTKHRSLIFTRAEEHAAALVTGPPEDWLYEPSPAFMKSGCFNLIAARWGLRKLHDHTHLYTGPAALDDFPGRVFRIEGVYPGDGRGLPFTQGHIAVRNFPVGAEALRARLKLKDGGDDYLFACTLADDRKALIHGRKT